MNQHLLMMDDLIKHNCHYWAAENSRCFCEIPYQHQWSINVWCSIVNGYIIGSHFFSGTLTSAIYNDFLQNTLPQLSEDVDLATRQRLWMQQDGAPHTRNVRNILNQIFPNCWIGKDGPVSWLFKSPDLI